MTEDYVYYPLLLYNHLMKSDINALRVNKDDDDDDNAFHTDPGKSCKISVDT